MSTVYVATVDTRYEIVAAADNPEGAKRLAAELALKYMQREYGPRGDTVEGMLEYFCPNVTRVEVGTAVFVGNEKVLPR